MSGPVDVRIDELVLDGLHPAYADRLADELAWELGRLIARYGPPGPKHSAGRVEAALQGPPTGASVAQAIYRGVTRCST